jgi:hypothetical protein
MEQQQPKSLPDNRLPGDPYPWMSEEAIAMRQLDPRGDWALWSAQLDAIRALPDAR